VENGSEHALQRVGPLAELAALVSRLGVDPIEIIAESGLQPSELKADRYIPLSLFADILDRAAIATAVSRDVV
jgi:hypothetical protein